ncbi:MAG: hypothetical protein GXP08_09095 [Gammaproteobacteria bacterium]|nr:hypothetical protein [Gammaproteobacteria bacterium]
MNIRRVAKEVIVILNNARYHYAYKATDVVEKSSRLQLVYLSACSPELTLIERLRHFFKQNVLYNPHYKKYG